MASDPGSELAGALRRQLLRLLARTRAALSAQGLLSGLEPAGDDWAGTPVAGRLLAPLGTLTVEDPIAASVLRGLTGLAGGGGSLVASLHGWNPDPAGGAQPLGLAYAVRRSEGGQVLTAAVALTGEGDAARVTLVAGGAQDAEAAEVTLGGGWGLQFSGHTGGTLEVSVGLDGVAAVSGATDGDRLRIGFRRPERGPPGRLGPPGGPGINPGAVGFGGDVLVDAAGGVVPTGWVSVDRGSVELVPGALAGLLPSLAPLPLDLELALDRERGATIGGSTTLTVRLPVTSPSPAFAIDALELALRPVADGPSLAVDVAVTASLRLSLPGVPVELRFDGHGLRLPFSFDEGRLPGFHGEDIAPLLPTGAGLSLDLPVLRGAGRLSHRRSPGPPPRDDWAGALSVSLPPMSASAYGVLGLPGEGRPFSLLVVLGATFPPPGIQLGFGFAVSGIGGVVGINRRIDREALMRAVADGTAANLLFPSDPVKAGDAVIDALPAIFPPMRGAVVAGPMLQLSWGGRMVSASVAVLMEASDRARLTILGKLVVAIPDPEAPLILIQATFAGQIDPGVPSVDFLASLTGSHIVFVPLSGDLFLLVRGGGDPTFVLSAGGFHPAFAIPRGVPELRRIGMDLSPSPVIDLRCEAYFAVTTNTVQFGARLELVAQVAGCGLRGHLGLDVLVAHHPHPSFIADISAGIAIEVFGETLAGIRFDLRLEGPTPWRARGRGSIDLFLFSASFDFDEQWGLAPPPPLAPEDVGARLRDALSARDAWVIARPGAGPGALQLTPETEADLGRGALVHPHGSLVVRQRTVPLGVTVERFNGAPVPAQVWDIAEVELGPDSPAPFAGEVREEFAPGQFFALSDDQQLSRPAFERLRGGYALTGTDVVMPEPRGADLGFETKVILDDEPGVDFELAGVARLLALETVVAAPTAAHPLWWQVTQPSVSLAAETPVSLASSWSLGAAGGPGAPTATELRRTLAAEERPGLAVVESWELAG